MPTEKVCLECGQRVEYRPRYRAYAHISGPFVKPASKLGYRGRGWRQWVAHKALPLEIRRD
jgi:hypothetical protein